jgi:hypothetical protein
MFTVVLLANRVLGNGCATFEQKTLSRAGGARGSLAWRTRRTGLAPHRQIKWVADREVQLGFEGVKTAVSGTL